MAIPFGNFDHSFTEKPCNSFWGEGPDHPSRQRLLERTLFLGSLLNRPPLLKNIIGFSWSIAALQCCVNQPYIHIYPLLFGFPSHLGHHKALN